MAKIQLKISSLIFLLLITSCSENSDKDYQINYKMIKFEKYFGDCDTLNRGCAKISFEYPEIIKAVDDNVKDSLKSYVMGTLLSNYYEQKAKSLDEMAELFFDDYESFYSEMPEYKIGWELNNTISVIFNNSSIVSFQSDFYHFTGGAHGISGTLFTNFNSHDGKKLSLDDLLITGYNNKLNDIAEKIFRRNYELTPDASLEEAGFWFEGNKFALNDNFGIKNDGLIFFFNSYEIASYATGPTEIIIPYEEIKDLIDTNGLLYSVVSEKN